MDDPNRTTVNPTPPPASPTPPPASPPPPSSWDVRPTHTPPAWRSPHDRHDESRTASLVIGLFVLALGLWFFAEHTLGIRMPILRWSQLWPVILIAVGVLMLLGPLRRRR